MSEINRTRITPYRSRFQRGTAAVEFALLALIFFTLVFGIIEVARALYIINTLQEVTRRAASAAATANHTDANALASIRRNAIFRNSPGELLFAAPITDRNVRIDYWALERQADGSMARTRIPDASLPATARQNIENCVTNPNAANCIRFVRASICADDGAAACTALNYQPLVSLIPFTMPISRATTITAVESLGSMPTGAP